MAEKCLGSEHCCFSLLKFVLWNVGGLRFCFCAKSSFWTIVVGVWWIFFFFNFTLYGVFFAVQFL